MSWPITLEIDRVCLINLETLRVLAYSFRDAKFIALLV